MDTVCRRYPHNRPSDYLELGEWEGFQLDSALAIAGEKRDIDLQMQFFEALREDLKIIMKALGVKIKNKKELKPVMPTGEETPKLNDVLKAWGGRGIIVKKTK